MAELRRAVALLKTLDDAIEWRDTFKRPVEKGRRFILFEEIVTADNIDGDGTRGGWEGSLAMTREDALAMMMWLEARCRSELGKLGVTP